MCVHVLACRYPEPLTKELQSKQPLSLTGKFCCTWRGGGFRDEHKQFFELLMGKCYRVPGFLATSLNRSKAMDFISRADKAHPRILWCILVRVTDCSHISWSISGCFARSVTNPQHDQNTLLNSSCMLVGRRTWRNEKGIPMQTREIRV